MYISLFLFAITYMLMLMFSKYRTHIALASAAVFVLSGLLPIDNIFNTIDFNVFSLFIESKMPDLLADLVMEKVPNIQTAAVAMALFAGIISAFIDNVATVLMVAPVALQICKKLNTNPIPFIIAIAVSSNLQGAATLVGDTTSIMLGSALDMSFIDFFWYNGRPGMFFAVELGAALTVVLLLIIFRKEKQPLKIMGDTKVTDYFPTILLLIVVACLIGASFIPEPTNAVAKIFFDHRNGIICMGLLLVGVIYNICKNKNFEGTKNMLKEMDYETLLLLASLFVVVGCIDQAGVIDKLAEGLAAIGGSNLFLMYTIIVFASVAVSAFVDNIPYVMTMLPVVAGVASAMNVDPTVLYFGLLVGATLGGNITPVGASANITGIGMLRKEGYEVKAKDFMKISVPFTLTAVLSGYAFIWLCYGMAW